MTDSDCHRFAAAENPLRKALEDAYLELKRHDADYHYRTPVSVNSRIVDALTTTDAQAVGMREALEQIEAIADRPISGTSLQMKANRFDAIKTKARAALAAQPPAAPVECDTVKHMWDQVEKARTDGTFSSPLPQSSAGIGDVRQKAEDAIRTFCQSLGAGSVSISSDGVERIYYAGLNLKALSAAVALAVRDVPQAVPTREEIGKIIDPMAFQTVPGSEAHTRALHKADRILALSRPNCGSDQ